MDINKLKLKLENIEKELDKVRSSSFIDGWQTQKHAKKSRKWDELAKEKFELQKLINDYEKEYRYKRKRCTAVKDNGCTCK